MHFGYIRVSTHEQHIERQEKELLKYVDSERNIYVDKISGTTKERPALNALKLSLRKGDTLYIHELDRLGRNKQLILEELKYFKENDILVKFLDLPTTLIDLKTFGSFETSVLELVNSLLIEVLSTLAEQEYQKNKKRQLEGIEIALNKGVKFGRPRTPITNEFIALYGEWKEGHYKAVEVMKLLNLTKPTFYNLVKRYESEKGINLFAQ